MPNIKTYNTPALDIRPTEVGVEATAAVGRRAGTMFREAAGALQDLGNRIGSTVKDAGDAAVAYMDHQQISQGAAKGSELADNLNQSYSDMLRSVDPNNAAPAIQQWRQKQMEPAFEKFRDGFTTEKSQQWAEHFIDSYRNHATTRGGSDMMTMAAHAVHLNQEQTLNKLTKSVYNDPTYLDTAIDMYKHSLDGLVKSSPRLSAGQIAQINNELPQKANKQLVHTAISSIIRNGGDWSKVADKNSPYVDRAELETFARAEKVQQRYTEMQRKQLELYGKQQATEFGKEELSKNFTDNVSFDETGRATVKPGFFQNTLDIVSKYPGLINNEAKAYINFAQSQQRERKVAVTSDAETKSDLLTRMFDPEHPTTDTDILTAAAQDKLSRHDVQNLRALAKSTNALKGPVYQGAMSAAKEALGHNILADGADRYSNFLQTFIPEYTKQQRAGTLPPNALNTRDPESLISKSIDQFRPTPAQLLQGRALKNFGITDVNQLPSRPLNLAPGSPDRGDWPRVNTKEERDALPSGTRYIGPDGRPARKP